MKSETKQGRSTEPVEPAGLKKLDPSERRALARAIARLLYESEEQREHLRRLKDVQGR